MNDEIRTTETELNEMTGKGQMLDALARFYAEDCKFEEGDGSRREGRDAQHRHLSAFFASLKGLNSATLHAQSTGPNVSMSEWTFDMTAADGTPVLWNEVLVRRWKGGRVESERFYQTPSRS
ncbi:ester cyclase [Myxococcota bacterium]|nr:ester cyclase [Myxococcota bacterium]